MFNQIGLVLCTNAFILLLDSLKMSVSADMGCRLAREKR